MLFTSIEFIGFFLPFVVFLYFRIAKGHFVRGCVFLVACSLLFYAWWNPRDLLLILFSVVFNYFASIRIARAGPRTKIWLSSGLVVNLVLLAYFKYSPFIAKTLGVTYDWGLPKTLPLAISFFTFQQIAYLLHVYEASQSDLKLKAPPAFYKYSLFITFFPHLIAGPIVQDSDFIEQVGPEIRLPQSRNIWGGLSLFLIGLSKKLLIADLAAPVADIAFDSVTKGVSIGAAGAVLGVFAYAVQLYFDFSGYSDMAIGLAKLFNIRLPQNFNSPYRAKTLTEFWQRWHMTLTTLLRDYVYTPLAFNGPWRGTLYGSLFCTFLTMVISGVWHGAGWQFVVWGALHGVGMVVNRAAERSKRFSLPAIPSQILTLGFVLFTWIFFRSPSLGIARQYLKEFTHFHNTASLFTAKDWVLVLGLFSFSQVSVNSLELGEKALAIYDQVPSLRTLAERFVSFILSPRLAVAGVISLVLFLGVVIGYYRNGLDLELYRSGRVHSIRWGYHIDNSLGAYRQNVLNTKFAMASGLPMKKIALVGSSFANSTPSIRFALNGQTFEFDSVSIGGNYFDQAIRTIGMVAQFNPEAIVIGLTPLNVASYQKPELDEVRGPMPSECVDVFNAVVPQFALPTEGTYPCLHGKIPSPFHMPNKAFKQVGAFLADTRWMPPVGVDPDQTDFYWKDFSLATSDDVKRELKSLNEGISMGRLSPDGQALVPDQHNGEASRFQWNEKHPVALLRPGGDFYAVLGQVKEYLDERGIPLIVYSTPTAEAENNKIYPPGYLNSYRAAMADLCRDLKIPYLDLSDYLPWRKKWMNDFVHPTYPARALLAKRLILSLIENNLIGAKSDKKSL